MKKFLKKSGLRSKFLLMGVGLSFVFSSKAQLDVTTGGTITTPKNISVAPIYVHGTTTTGILIWRGNLYTNTNMGIGLGTLASTSGNGVNNIAIGDNSMNKTTTDNNNLAIGNNSMRYLNSGLTPNGGNNNISLGHSSLQMPAAPGAGYTN